MGEMISEGRIPLTEAENAVVEEKIAAHPDANLSLTRDENGTLIIETPDAVHLVSEDGTVTDG